jgi:hypothetical protein
MTDFFSIDIIIARKEHKCECFLGATHKDPHRYRRHFIHKGQRYARIAQVYEGKFSHSKICLVHWSMIQYLFNINADGGDGIDYARMREYFDIDKGEWLNTLNDIRKIHRGLRNRGKKP